MSNLQLSLKQKWFDMTKSGVKTEDYREVTPYWCAVLLTYQGDKKSKIFWESEIERRGYTFSFFGKTKPLDFYFNIMTLGYPKSTDTERIIKLEHKGIDIRTGNPDWGAIEGKLYFVIKHGEIFA